MEYSNNFNFFLKHQVGIAYSQGTTTIFSRLDGERFYKMNHGRQLTADETQEKCYEIWNKQIKEKEELSYG